MMKQLNFKVSPEYFSSSHSKMISIKFLVFLTVSFLQLGRVHSSRFETFSAIIRELIDNERVSSVLWIRACWPKRDTSNFVKNSTTPIQLAEPNAIIDFQHDENINKQWFFVDMACDGSSEYLLNTDAKFFAHPYRWIIADAPLDLIQNLTFLPGSNLILINEELNSNEYSLKQAYKIGRDYPVINEEFGYWHRNKGLVDLRPTRILSRRRRNLKGHTLVTATVFAHKGSENHTDLDDYNHNTVDIISKVCFVVSQFWIESINATMDVRVHRTWGYKDKKTGLFSGMTGELQQKEADIGATSLFMTSERVEFLEYLSTPIASRFAFVLRAPPISYVSNIYYLPFSGTVWMCCISLVLLSVFVIFVTSKFNPIQDDSSHGMIATDYVMYAVRSIAQMGPEILTKLMSSRIAMIFFSVALLFLYTSFTANIVALLQSTTKSIQTIADLQNPSIEIGVHDIPYSRHYFKIDTEQSRKRLYETKVVPPNKPDAYMNLTHGLNRLRGGMFAFHMETSSGYHQIEKTFFENEKCGLVEIKFFQMTDTWVVAQKPSPYKEILNIVKLREHGIHLREKARVYTQRPVCTSDGKNFGSVRFMDCYAALMIYVAGFSVSFLLFAVEKLKSVYVNYHAR